MGARIVLACLHTLNKSSRLDIVYTEWLYQPVGRFCASFDGLCKLWSVNRLRNRIDCRPDSIEIASNTLMSRDALLLIRPALNFFELDLEALRIEA